MDSVSAALTGMRSAQSRFDRASDDLLRAASGESDADMAGAIVDQIEAKLQFQASAKTLHAADYMTGVLLDILA